MLYKVFPLINLVPIWHPPQLSQLYWVYSLCCTLRPCDDFLTASFYFTIPLPLSPSTVTPALWQPPVKGGLFSVLSGNVNKPPVMSPGPALSKLQGGNYTWGQQPHKQRMSLWGHSCLVVRSSKWFLVRRAITSPSNCCRLHIPG